MNLQYIILRTLNFHRRSSVITRKFICVDTGASLSWCWWRTWSTAWPCRSIHVWSVGQSRTTFRSSRRTTSPPKRAPSSATVLCRRRGSLTPDRIRQSPSRSRAKTVRRSISTVRSSVRSSTRLKQNRSMKKKYIFLHRWWITGIWRTAAASAEAATVLQSEGAGPERGVTFGDAGRRNKVGTLLMGSRLSDSLRLQGDDARLPSGEMAKLVSIYILHFHDMDKLLQLHHGVDDHDNR